MAMTPDELAAYQQEAEDEATQSVAERGRRLRKMAVQILAMAATLTGVATGGSVDEPLPAPTLDWDDEPTDLTPDFTIGIEDAEVGDIVTIRRSSTSDFASYEDETDTIDSLAPPTTLLFPFEGDWTAQIWFVKSFYTRGGEDSEESTAILVDLDSSLYWNCSVAEVGYAEGDTVCTI